MWYNKSIVDRENNLESEMRIITRAIMKINNCSEAMADEIEAIIIERDLLKINRCSYNQIEEVSVPVYRELIEDRSMDNTTKVEESAKALAVQFIEDGQSFSVDVDSEAGVAQFDILSFRVVIARFGPKMVKAVVTGNGDNSVLSFNESACTDDIVDDILSEIFN